MDGNKLEKDNIMLSSSGLTLNEEMLAALPEANEKSRQPEARSVVV